MSATLPLFESDLLYRPTAKSLIRIRTTPDQLIPARKPEPGEQYRFHFDMTKCIGCKCCVVACNEQNGNPASDQLAPRRRDRRRPLSRTRSAIISRWAAITASSRPA